MTDSSLFKYSSFSSYSLSNLLNDELHLNHYAAFNDPFECRCQILSGFPPKDPSVERVRNIVRAWGYDDVTEIALDNYDDYVFSLEGTEPDIETMIEAARISCFSKTTDNLLMWSHYGDGLRGFCIEFDSSYLLEYAEQSGSIFEVLYSDEPAVIDTAVIAVLNDQAEFHESEVYQAEKMISAGILDRSKEIDSYRDWLTTVYARNSEIYRKMLATKPTEWGYEEEVRVILAQDKSDSANDFLKYPKEAVRSVIVGERMPVRHVKALKAALTQHKIQFSRAARIPGSFKISVTGI